MDSTLLTIAFLAAGYALLISIGVTAFFIVLMLKLRKAGIFGTDKKEKTAEDDNISELVRINFDIVRDLEKSDERTEELIAKFNETNQRLEALIDERIQENNKAAELAMKLTAVIEQNKELAARLSELEALKKQGQSLSDQNGPSAERIRELEELVNYKDSYYAETAGAERRLRAGVCGAIDSLIRTRGSDSIEYLEEQIEDVIKILDDSRTKSK